MFQEKDHVIDVYLKIRRRRTQYRLVNRPALSELWVESSEAFQAMEAIKYIIGKGELLTGRLLTYDALSMTFRTIKLPKNHDCPVCGDHPTITKLIDYEQAECDMHM